MIVCVERSRKSSEIVGKSGAVTSQSGDVCELAQLK